MIIHVLKQIVYFDPSILQHIDIKNTNNSLNKPTPFSLHPSGIKGDHHHTTFTSDQSGNVFHYLRKSMGTLIKEKEKLKYASFLCYLQS